MFHYWNRYINIPSINHTHKLYKKCLPHYSLLNNNLSKVKQKQNICPAVHLPVQYLVVDTFQLFDLVNNKNTDFVFFLRQKWGKY